MMLKKLHKCQVPGYNTYKKEKQINHCMVVLVLPARVHDLSNTDTLRSRLATRKGASNNNKVL